MRVSPGLGTEVAEDMPSIHTTAAHLDPRTYAYPYGHLRTLISLCTSHLLPPSLTHTLCMALCSIGHLLQAWELCLTSPLWFQV